MITVCHIITKLELGGAQQNTLYTVKHLDQQRFRPLLITGIEGPLVEEIRTSPQVHTHYLPELVREIRLRQDLTALANIYRILQRELRATPHTPCIVHTHSSKAGVLGRWAAKLAGVRNIIHSIHGFGFHPYQSPLVRGLYTFLERITARITTHFIAVSSANITTGLRLGLFTEPNVSLIRSGIDIARFRQAGEGSAETLQLRRTETLRQLRLSPDNKIVAMIACFKPQKAPLDFIRVMRLVADHVPNVHAIMAGDGELRPQIEALISELNLEQTISLLGWRTDIPELMAASQALVLTSRWEGLPRVCPQAMAVGLPIVATTVDGIPEAVHHGVNGFLVNPGQVKDMADHLIFLLTHPEDAKMMGIRGQQMVAEFDIDRMVHQQEELYERLVEEHNV